MTGSGAGAPITSLADVAAPFGRWCCVVALQGTTDPVAQEWLRRGGWRAAGADDEPPLDDEEPLLAARSGALLSTLQTGGGDACTVEEGIDFLLASVRRSIEGTVGDVETLWTEWTDAIPLATLLLRSACALPARSAHYLLAIEAAVWTSEYEVEPGAELVAAAEAVIARAQWPAFLMDRHRTGEEPLDSWEWSRVFGAVTSAGRQALASFVRSVGQIPPNPR